jgi:hypothetical protein
MTCTIKALNPLKKGIYSRLLLKPNISREPNLIGWKQDCRLSDKGSI